MSKACLTVALVAAVCLPLHALADTIQIERTRYCGPYALLRPVEIDSVSPSNKAFSFTKVFGDNNPNAAALLRQTDARILHFGDALPVVTGKPSISYLHFTLDADRYTKAELRVRNIANYRVYVDDRQGSTALALTPGRHNVVVACMNEGKADTVRLSLESKQEKALTVNAGGKRPYTLHDITDGLHYTGASMSPTGTYAIINYTNTLNTGEQTTANDVVELATGRTLFTFTWQNYAWMPHEDALYSLRKDNSGNTLVSLSLLTGRETVIAEGIPDAVKNGTLSPNMDYYIYYTYDNTGDTQGNLKKYEMPDDRMSGWRNRANLNIYDLRTGLTQPLTFGNHSTYLQDISADGKQLLLSTSRTDLCRYPFSRTSLYRYTVADGRLDTLLTDTVGINEVKFSPDSRILLVKGTPDALGGVGKQISANRYSNMYDEQLFLLDIASGQARAMTKTFNPSVANATWSEHDGQIYFTAADGGKVSFYSLNPKSGAIHRYPYPVDYIQGYSISARADRIMYYGQGATYARRMYTASLSDKKGKSRPAGKIDFDQMSAGIAIGSCKPWAFRTTRGDTIQGRFYLPPDFDETRQYPLIVYYYGGCTPTTETLETNYPHEVWAGLGYVVYVVEPSGTIGYGQEFSSRHVNAWGKFTADDIIEGTKQFQATHPYVNADRMACIGASYGGFMTEYLLTKTSMYHTAISHAGISDLTGYWGGGYWGYSYNEIAAAGSFPWNNKDLYVNQSPLYNADKIHTPLLLIQGTEDTNVPNTQAHQLYTALKILGRPVEYVQVKGENHVVRDYAKQKEWQTLIFAWFAKMLKDQSEWWDALCPPRALQ